MINVGLGEVESGTFLNLPQNKVTFCQGRSFRSSQDNTQQVLFTKDIAILWENPVGKARPSQT